MILLPSLIAVTVKLIPKEILDQCRKDSAELWANGKPEKWYYAIPFVCIWLAVISLIAVAVLS